LGPTLGIKEAAEGKAFPPKPDTEVGAIMGQSDVFDDDGVVIFWENR
jgi:hypothetical protein